MGNFPVSLQLSVDRKQSGAQQFTPLLFRDVLPYHDVDLSRLVFEREESHAACRSRPLAVDHEACRARYPAVRDKGVR